MATVILAVIFQEAWRFAFYRVYVGTERKLLSGGVPGISSVALNDASTSLAAGIGFGTMHAVIVFGSVVANSVDAASFYRPECPEMNVYVMLAVQQLFFSLLHIALMIIAFSAFRDRSVLKTVLLLGLHFGGSATTLLNDSSHGCTVAAPLLAATAFAGIVAVGLIYRASQGAFFRRTAVQVPRASPQQTSR